MLNQLKASTLLALIPKNKGISFSEILLQVDCCERTLRYKLSNLVKSGKIKKYVDITKDCRMKSYQRVE